MANEYAVNQADLKTVADAIRAKAGLSDGLAFPDGFAEAIAAIASGGAASGLAYDMGEFSMEKDSAGTQKISVPHNLGDVPDFICVWTDDFAGITVAPYSSGSTFIGFIWLRSITGMTVRASSSADMKNPFCCCMTLSVNEYRMSGVLPTSASYGITTERPPDSESIFLAYLGASTYWRAGVTYKYFVSKAWWTVGGGASA